MSGPYFDVYVLCPERTEALARQFLDEWASGRISSDADYCIPRFGSHPVHVFTSPDELIRFLDANPCEEQAMYWQSGRDDEIEHAMLFYSSDGAMIAGLSVADWERPRDQVAAVLFRLARSVGARFGYVTMNQPPVLAGQDAFRAECARREIAVMHGTPILIT